MEERKLLVFLHSFHLHPFFSRTGEDVHINCLFPSLEIKAVEPLGVTWLCQAKVAEAFEALEAERKVFAEELQRRTQEAEDRQAGSVRWFPVLQTVFGLWKNGSLKYWEMT